MQYEKISIWWDGEGDLLWVNLADGDGDMVLTKDGKSTVKVDDAINSSTQRSVPMKKVRITYDTPLDALLAVTRQMGQYEDKYGMTTEDFFDRYNSGEMPCEDDYMMWEVAYRDFLSLRAKVSDSMKEVA